MEISCFRPYHNSCMPLLLMGCKSRLQRKVLCDLELSSRVDSETMIRSSTGIEEQSRE